MKRIPLPIVPDVDDVIDLSVERTIEIEAETVPAAIVEERKPAFRSRQRLRAAIHFDRSMARVFEIPPVREHLAMPAPSPD